jgi:hypothetical protein
LHDLDDEEIAQQVEKAAERVDRSQADLHDEIAEMLRRSAGNIRAGRPPLDPPDR